jgi:hypothetical protein
LEGLRQLLGIGGEKNRYFMPMAWEVGFDLNLKEIRWNAMGRAEKILMEAIDAIERLAGFG